MNSATLQIKSNPCFTVSGKSKINEKKTLITLLKTSSTTVIPSMSRPEFLLSALIQLLGIKDKFKLNDTSDLTFYRFKKIFTL